MAKSMPKPAKRGEDDATSHARSSTMSRMSANFGNPVFQGGFTALACLLSGLLAYTLVDSAMTPALFWPPAGVAVGAAILWGWRVIPAASLGTGLAALAWGVGGVPALWLGLSIAIQAGLGWYLLGRVGVSKAFDQVGDLFRLVLHAGLLASLAALPLSYLALSEASGFWEYNLAWRLISILLGQLDGVLVFAPLMLCWRDTAYAGRRAEVLLALLGLGLGALLLAHPMLFGLPATSLRPYPLLPLLLWLALRGGIRLTASSLAWIYAVMAANAEWGHWAVVAMSNTQWVRPLNGFITVIGISFLALGMLMATNRRLEQAHLKDVLAQRDALVREVHHRIKNNLQTVIGLLRRDAAKHPEARPMLESAINQVQSIAVVHGLHGRVMQQGVMLCELLPAICDSISAISAVAVTVDGVPRGCGVLHIQENETVAMALILNELISNAIKHMPPDADSAEVSVTLIREGGTGRVRIRNPGKLPSGFDFSRGKELGTGLGLVRALLPSGGVDIAFRQDGKRVVTEIRIGPPVLTLWRDQEAETCEA